MPRFRNLPVTLRVPLITAALMIVLAGGQPKRAGRAWRVQDARLSETARLHVEGLSVALGLPSCGRTCGRSTTSSTARGLPVTGSGFC
jgi:hypothetical protein